MKMRILGWLLGKNEKGRGKNEKGQGKTEKTKNDQYVIMPDFRRLFAALPNIIKTTAIEQKDTKMQDALSVQEHAAAKIVAQREAKTATSKEKVRDVYTRIQTAKSKNVEIIWLLQTNEDIPYKSLSDLIGGYQKVKASDSYRGMSVNYASNEKLHTISDLTEEDLEGLAKKLESGERESKSSPPFAVTKRG
jgi:hypothetical protein